MDRQVPALPGINPPLISVYHNDTNVRIVQRNDGRRWSTYARSVSLTLFL